MRLDETKTLIKEAQKSSLVPIHRVKNTMKSLTQKMVLTKPC